MGGRLFLSGVLFSSVTFCAMSAGAVAVETPQLTRAGTIEMAGRQVRCGSVRTRLDRSLPNLGAASPDARIVLLNPDLLRRYSGTVQLFVFHHECGHHQVGESELAADCWAVGQGVRNGWLDRNGLAQVCRSFANAPETSTHPSGRRRCANIDRCFATAERAAAQDQAKARETRAERSAPRLVSGPRLVRSTLLR